MRILFLTSFEHLAPPETSGVDSSIGPFWLKALKESDHELSVFLYDGGLFLPASIEHALVKTYSRLLPRIRKLDKRFRDRYYKFCPFSYARNRRFLEQALGFKPDVVLIWNGNAFLRKEVLEHIEIKFKTRVAILVDKAPVNHVTCSEKAIAPALAVAAASDEGHAMDYMMLSAPESMVLPVAGIYPDFHKRVELTETEKKKYGSSVAYVGNWFKGLEKSLIPLTGFDLAIWGGKKKDWRSYPELSERWRGHANRETAVKIYNAADIIVNLHDHTMQFGGNPATFEIAGSGGFQVVDRYDKSWFRKGHEIVTFKDSEDLVKVIDRFLADDEKRRRVSDAAFKKAHKKHTYAERLKKMLAGI